MATNTFFDCQFDGTNLTNSFVAGRASTTSDLGKFIVNKKADFDSDLMMGIGMEDGQLASALNLLGWNDVFVDDSGNQL